MPSKKTVPVLLTPSELRWISDALTLRATRMLEHADLCELATGNHAHAKQLRQMAQECFSLAARVYDRGSQ